MPSYMSYKRQMAVLDADDNEIESWITVKGNHIPIKKGQSKEDAVKSFIEKQGGSAEKKSEPKAKHPPLQKGQLRLHRDIDDRYAIIDPDGAYTFYRDGVKGAQNRSLKGQEGAVKELGEIGYKAFNDITTPEKSEKTETAPKENETDKLYNEIGEYMKANKLPIDEQEHLIALRKMLKNDVNSTEHVKRNFEKWFSNKKQQQTKETSAKKSDSRLVNAVATALGTSVEEAESEIEGAAQHIHDLIKAKDLRNGDVEETLRGLGVEPDYADEFMQWATYPRRKKK